MREINPEQYPETVRSILTELSKIPEQIMALGELPEPPSEKTRIEMTILETLKVVDSHAELVYTESVAVPVLEHQGPDIQYTHVPHTDAIKDLPGIYWGLVSED